MKKEFDEERIVGTVHTLLQEDKNYKKQLVKDLTQEEYERFLKECPEFLEE